MWLNVGLALHRRLERWGFEPTAPVTYLAAAPLGELPPVPDPLCARSWHFTMADSDVY